MKRLLSFICCLLSFASPIVAEVVVLQSGKTMQGTILQQDDQIVLLLDAEGRRYQLPKAEITAIQEDPRPVEETAQEDETTNDKKGQVALRLDLSGGAVFIPPSPTGGYGSVDLQIGTRSLAGKRIFLGGSVGYQAAAMQSLYSFLPLMVVFSMPLTDTPHAPEVGAALGYGFAIKQPHKGGMTAKLDLSWRYQYSATSALLLGVQARFQQAEVSITETINNQDYTATLGRNCVGVGLRLAFVF